MTNLPENMLTQPYKTNISWGLLLQHNGINCLKVLDFSVAKHYYNLRQERTSKSVTLDLWMNTLSYMATKIIRFSAFLI